MCLREPKCPFSFSRDFSRDFVRDFSRDFVRDFSMDFLRDFSSDFVRDFFQVIVQVNFLHLLKEFSLTPTPTSPKSP